MTQPIERMESEQARTYMEKNKPDQYTLLDVRQDWEYEEFHIPGAKLIPLSELIDRVGEIDKGKPVLVYCAAGARSSAAAALLEGQGYEDIKDILGGAMSWQGHAAYGPIDLGMIEFMGHETPEELVFKAYAMENILQTFYLYRSDVAETSEQIALFTQLAGFEDKHKDTLYTLYTRIADQPLEREVFEAKAEVCSVTSGEGGVDVQEFIDDYAEGLEGDAGVLQVASMIEAQALDYYLRCAMQADNPETEDMLQLLAREEKAHLKLIAKFMDREEEQ